MVYSWHFWRGKIKEKNIYPKTKVISNYKKVRHVEKVGHLANLSERPTSTKVVNYVGKFLMEDIPQKKCPHRIHDGK